MSDGNEEEKPLAGLGAELRGISPLIFLIFLEVAALGLPSAILPIIATTEFAKVEYKAGVLPEGSTNDRDRSLAWTNEEAAGNVCTVGPSCLRLEDCPGGAVALACPEGGPSDRDTEPCCGPCAAGLCLTFPDTCPVGVDNYDADAASPFYYLYRSQCQDGNKLAARALGWADGLKGILTFLMSGTIGVISDSKGRKNLLILAEIVAFLPNVMLLVWFRTPISIYAYYSARSFTGLMNSVAVGVAYVVDKTSDANRAVCIGILVAIAALGAVSSPIGAAMPYELAFWVSNGMAIGCVVFTYFCVEESLPEEKRKPLDLENVKPWHNMNILVRNKLFFVLTVLILMNSSSNKGLNDINLYFLQATFGFTSANVGLLVVLLAVSVIVTQGFLLKPLVAKLGERGVIILALACGLVYYGGMVLASFAARAWQAFILVVIFGSVSVLSFPAVSAMESRNSADDEQGLVQGALFGAQSLAQAGGNLLFPVLYECFFTDCSPTVGGRIAYIAGTALQTGALLVALLLPTEDKYYKPVSASADAVGDNKA